MCAKKLTIVSDTALFFNGKSYYGFGPVVKEIEFIEHLFDQIVWIGFDRQDRMNDLSMRKINSSKIKFILLNRVGGKNIKSIFEILLSYPNFLKVIKNEIIDSDVIHTRAPSHPALAALFLSFFYKDKIWWNKYAGDWSQKKPSFSYGFQRWLLKKATHTKVTINGFWEKQPSHCYSFENPCLTSFNIEDGKKLMLKRDFNLPFTFCFVGRLEDVKGIPRIIEALKQIQIDLIKEVHFIGDGRKLENYKNHLSFLNNKVYFHGFLNSEKVHYFLKKSDFILLPSDLEGFPKVVAEAACFGVIPIVSNAGSISHYVNDKNGFLWDINSNSEYKEAFIHAINEKPDVLIQKSKEVLLLAEKFTFEKYLEKLKKHIL